MARRLVASVRTRKERTVGMSILKVPSLSVTQVNAIGFGARYSSLADNYSLTADDVYRESTLSALERKGFLFQKNGLSDGRWLTAKGLEVLRDFKRAHEEKFPQQYRN